MGEIHVEGRGRETGGQLMVPDNTTLKTSDGPSHSQCVHNDPRVEPRLRANYKWSRVVSIENDVNFRKKWEHKSTILIRYYVILYNY